jgi:L-cysteine S-thiosulfotransferase
LRFPDRARLALLAAVACASGMCAAGPTETKGEIAARLQAQLPSLSTADYALGAAAFDAELKASVDANADAGAATIAAGRKVWEAKFKDGRSLASCFPNGGRRVAALYPQWDPRLKRIVTLEMAVNQCRKVHREEVFDMEDRATMGAAIAYVRSLADGQKISVRVPPAAEDRFQEGRRLYFARMGQRNFACASCHLQGAGRWFAEKPLSPAIGQATHWPEIRDGAPVAFQARMRECLALMGAAPFAFGSEELNRIEYFLTYLSNGLALRSNVWRSSK